MAGKPTARHGRRRLGWWPRRRESGSVPARTEGINTSAPTHGGRNMVKRPTSLQILTDFESNSPGMPLVSPTRHAIGMTVMTLVSV
jgi:hypothetical protein